MRYLAILASAVVLTGCFLIKDDPEYPITEATVELVLEKSADADQRGKSGEIPDVVEDVLQNQLIGVLVFLRRTLTDPELPTCDELGRTVTECYHWAAGVP